MSTFTGLFVEFPGISADRFDGDNLNSKIFLLSHCHADHMYGLNKAKDLPGPIYTSSVSAVLLKKQYPHISNIKVLQIRTPHAINYCIDDCENQLQVTALPARHCPGSIMMLIQSHTHTVLYTGDFRLSRSDLEKSYMCLKNSFVDTAYLDSTFLSKFYKDFPTQYESVQVICDLIEEWILKSKQHIVVLETPAQYGSEYLFIKIAKKFSCKIHVNNEQWEKYIYFPDMDSCISKNGDECQIHACEKKSNIRLKLTTCSYLYGNEVRNIRPSALLWRFWKRGDPLFTQSDNNNKTMYKVVYSNHSSCKEIKEFLDFVKPKSVKLNVLPTNVLEQVEMIDTLDSIYTAKKRKENPNTFTFKNDVIDKNMFAVPIKKKVNVSLPKRLKM